MKNYYNHLHVTYLMVLIFVLPLSCHERYDSNLRSRLWTPAQILEFFNERKFHEDTMAPKMLPEDEHVSPLNSPTFATEPVPHLDLNAHEQEHGGTELEHCIHQINDPKNQVKIAKGKAILKILFNLTPPVPRTTAQISKVNASIHLPKALTDIEQDIHLNNDDYKKKYAEYIVWALYGIAAHQKGIYFTEGTFKIEDPGLKLKKYLESCPDVYKRLSTHFNAFKHNEWTDLHNGLDLDDIPCNKKHILFDNLNDRFTFLKPENFGLHKVDHIIGHIEELFVAKARKIEILRNLFNLEPDNAAGWSKERTPKEILSNFKKLIETIEDDEETRKNHIQSANNFGIEKIVPILNEYMKDYRKSLEKLRPLSSSALGLSGSWLNIGSPEDIKVEQIQDTLVRNLNVIETFLQKAIGNRDNLEMRSGEEIVISIKNMQDALGDIAADAQEAVLMDDLQESEVD